jgi:L-asparagine oxygenase
MKVELPKKPRVVQISKTAQGKVRKAAEYLHSKYGSISNPLLRVLLPREAALLLPDEVYLELAHFKEAFGYSDYGAIVFKGFWDVNQQSAGATPAKWQVAEKTQEIVLMELAFALVHAALGGNMIQYKCQRGGGGFTHQVIPDLTMADTQTGSGSAQDLSIHTEDAGLQTSAEFISLCWIRNNEQVPSYLSSVRSIDWYELEELETMLRKPIFTFYPDANYRYKPEISDFLHRSKMPILFGNDIHPWIRTDNVEMLGKQDNCEAEIALQWLEREIQANIFSGFTPEAGDMVVINNRMCGHGRGKFKAGFDLSGNAVERRWMLRMMSHTSPISTYKFIHEQTANLNEEMLAGYHHKELAAYIETV